MKNSIFLLLSLVSFCCFDAKGWSVNEREYRALFEMARDGVFLRGTLLLSGSRTNMRGDLDIYFSSLNVLLATQFNKGSYVKLKNDEFCELKNLFSQVRAKYSGEKYLSQGIVRTMFDASRDRFDFLEKRYNCTPEYKLRRKTNYGRTSE